MLRDQLQMLADTAFDYTDAERALRAHRTRRRRRVAVGVSAAAVLVLIATVVYALPGRSPIARDPSWIVPAAPVETSYPPELRLGTEPVPALPDGKIGPALLAAHTSKWELCRPACARSVLLTVAGERYALADGGDWSLSPDGRWLLGTFGRSYYGLRDLTADRPPRSLGVDAQTSDRWQPVAWSPDSRWVLMWRSRTGLVSDYQRVEVATGRTVTGTLTDGEQLLAVLASGDVLTGPTAAMTTLDRTDPVTLRILDPAGPTERGRVTLKDTVLAADRTIANGAPSSALVMPDGRGVVLTLKSPGQLAVLATVDLRTGDLIRGQQLSDEWRPMSVSGRGIVVTTQRRAGQEQPIDTIIGVVEPDAALSPATGTVEPAVLLRLGRADSVLLRGCVTWN
jgi:hypothetical protein